MQKHTMTASIEVLYTILGYSDSDILRNLLSLDKYFEFTCSYERIQRGILINIRKITLVLKG